MSELYKAIAGSPITYLAGDISAGQTTIAVADDSALPDAPNICTIGYGENIETIRYGAKSNGVLQNVTRGIEGTPRAWSAGTEVARFFTAYDHNSIIENFNSHLAECATKVIEEYGGNSTDGYYIKWGNGLTICLKRVTVNQNIGGSGSAFTTPLPISLTGSRARFAGFSPVEQGTAYGNISNLGNVITSVSTTQWSLRSTESNHTLNQELFLFAVSF